MQSMGFKFKLAGSVAFLFQTSVKLSLIIVIIFILFSDNLTSCYQLQQTGVTKSGFYLLTNKETGETYRVSSSIEA